MRIEKKSKTGRNLRPKWRSRGNASLHTDWLHREEEKPEEREALKGWLNGRCRRREALVIIKTELVTALGNDS